MSETVAAKVVFNTLLTPLHPEKNVFHIRFQSSEPLNYQAGDWLMVAAHNSAELVELILQKLGLTGEELITLRRVGEVPIKKALTESLELTLLSPAMLNKLKRQQGIDDWADRDAMMAYAKDRDVLDLLDAYPQLTGLAVCELLAPLAPRYYSIASSSKALGQDVVDLVYRQVAYQRADRERCGVVSTALSELTAGDDVEIALSGNRNFKLPSALAEGAVEAPIIMVGAGTGVAPFIGFLQEWFLAPKTSKNYQAWLFFGETHAEKSYLFKDALLGWQQQGLRLHTAFSRDQAEKVYVQDKLWQQREAVWQLINEGAYFYLCGDKLQLAQAVEETLCRIFVEQGGMTAEAAAEQWKQWKKSRRIQLDVY